MSKKDNRITSVTILEHEYSVSAPEQEQQLLIESADYVDEKMREIKGSGKTLNFERIAVLAALNLAHEVLQLKRDQVYMSQENANQVGQLIEKLDKFLQKRFMQRNNKL